MKNLLLISLGLLLVLSFGCTQETETRYYVCPDGREVLTIDECVVEDETSGEEPSEATITDVDEEAAPPETPPAEIAPEAAPEEFPEDAPEYYGLMPAEYMNIDAVGAAELIEMNPQIIIVDVSPAYAQGHIPGAVHYPIGDGSFDAAYSEWNPHEFYLIYCHADSPSIQAAQTLADVGFTEVYRLEGNYQAWVNAGFEIEK